MLKKLLLIITIFCFSLSFSSLAIAHDDTTQIVDEVKYEKVNPNDGFNYGFKRLKEKIGFALTFSKAKKADKYLEMINKRLAELKFVIENNDMANFEEATTRYFSTVGQYVDFLTKTGATFNKEAVIHKFSEHKTVLSYLRDKFQFEQAEYRFVQDDINYLQTYQDKLP